MVDAVFGEIYKLQTQTLFEITVTDVGKCTISNRGFTLQGTNIETPSEAKR